MGPVYSIKLRSQSSQEQFTCRASILTAPYGDGKLIPRAHPVCERCPVKKLEAHEGYVDQTRVLIFLAVQVYERREGMRESEKSEREMLAVLGDASRLRGRTFERVMLLGSDEVVEAGHRLNAEATEVDLQATGRTSGILDECRARNRAAFQAINNFRDAAREDLGVKGNVTCPSHPERDLLLPPTRRASEKAP